MKRGIATVRIPARILIVDDEPRNRQLMEILLQPEGHVALFAQGGEEALVMLGQSPPDLMLIDLMMPGMNGYELVAKIKTDAATRNIPIIIITAVDDRESRVRGLDAGAEDYLTKPVDRAELCVRVRNLLRLKAYADYQDNQSQRLEAEVSARTAQLEAANKELEAFSYSVSHNLRSPALAVSGFSEALLEDYGEQLPPEAVKVVHRILEGGRRMGNLIDGLLAFARLGRAFLRKEVVDMQQVAQAAFDDLYTERGSRKIDFKVEGLEACLGDPVLFAEVWTNLISNAVKFTATRENAVIRVGCSKDAGEVTYYVKDNGVGFDMRYSDKLFGVFERLHRDDEFEGTGVGLAIVHRIVSLYEGRIWAEAALDKGATFFFALPIHRVV